MIPTTTTTSKNFVPSDKFKHCHDATTDDASPETRNLPLSPPLSPNASLRSTWSLGSSIISRASIASITSTAPTDVGIDEEQPSPLSPRRSCHYPTLDGNLLLGTEPSESRFLQISDIPPGVKVEQLKSALYVALCQPSAAAVGGGGISGSASDSTGNADFIHTEEDEDHHHHPIKGILSKYFFQDRMAVVAFYDIRDAVKARRACLQGRVFPPLPSSNASGDAAFTALGCRFISVDELVQLVGESEFVTRTNGQLSLTCVEIPIPTATSSSSSANATPTEAQELAAERFTKAHLWELLTGMGPISSFECIHSSSDGAESTYMVEFNDVRNRDAAAVEVNGMEFLGVRIVVNGYMPVPIPASTPALPASPGSPTSSLDGSQSGVASYDPASDGSGSLEATFATLDVASASEGSTDASSSPTSLSFSTAYAYGTQEEEEAIPTSSSPTTFYYHSPPVPAPTSPLSLYHHAPPPHPLQLQHHQPLQHTNHQLPLTSPISPGVGPQIAIWAHTHTNVQVTHHPHAHHPGFQPPHTQPHAQQQGGGSGSPTLVTQVAPSMSPPLLYAGHHPHPHPHATTQWAHAHPQGVYVSPVLHHQPPNHVMDHTHTHTAAPRAAVQENQHAAPYWTPALQHQQPLPHPHPHHYATSTSTPPLPLATHFNASPVLGYDSQSQVHQHQSQYQQQHYQQHQQQQRGMGMGLMYAPPDSVTSTPTTATSSGSGVESPVDSVIQTPPMPFHHPVPGQGQYAQMPVYEYHAQAAAPPSSQGQGYSPTLLSYRPPMPHQPQQMGMGMNMGLGMGMVHGQWHPHPAHPWAGHPQQQVYPGFASAMASPVSPTGGASVGAKYPPALAAGSPGAPFVVGSRAKRDGHASGRNGENVGNDVDGNAYEIGFSNATAGAGLSNTTTDASPTSASAAAAAGAAAAGVINEKNQLHLDLIEKGIDTRTTVMVKNIPNKMSSKDLLKFIGEVCPRRVDFVYLRIDFANGCNVGYAFVNFITTLDLLKFAKARLSKKWNLFQSEKVLQMSYANYQGKEALIEKFKNSCIMDEREEWRPRIFYSSGPERGLPEPFPSPTHLRRKERSSFNRGELYGAGHHHNHHHQSHHQPSHPKAESFHPTTAHGQRHVGGRMTRGAGRRAHAKRHGDAVAGTTEVEVGA